MKKLLIIEDQIELLNNNRRFFTGRGYNVQTADSLKYARTLLEDGAPDAIILYFMLPDGSGLDFIDELRNKGDQTPVILLTAMNKPVHVANGIRKGANDYLAKPFDYEVLLARVEAMIKNSERMPDRIVYGPLTIDLLSGQTYLDNEDMLLTQKERALLLLFVQNPGKILNADYLFGKVWGSHKLDDNQALKKTVSRLRGKLAGSGHTITAERNEGYVLELE